MLFHFTRFGAGPLDHRDFTARDFILFPYLYGNGGAKVRKIFKIFETSTLSLCSQRLCISLILRLRQNVRWPHRRHACVPLRSRQRAAELVSFRATLGLGAAKT
jgi:hypothetical protein